MNEEVIINIDGTIDSYGWTSSNVRWQLKDAKGKKVRCKINSMGGDVAQAVAISHMFEDHGDVTVELLGFTASAATFVGFGAKCIEAHDDGLWLMHKCSTNLNVYKDMNSDEIQALIEELQKTKKNADAIDCMIAQKYLNRCKSAKNLQDILDLMKEEKWIPMTAAFELGFVDKIIPGATITDSMRNMVFHNCADMSLPEPPKVSDITTQSVSDEKKTTSSIVNDLLNSAYNFFTGKKAEDNTHDITNTNFKMNKKFEFVNAILNIEGVNDNGGQITLTAEQMTAINDALKSHSDALKTANDKAAAAETKFNNCIQSLDGLSDTIKTAEKMEDKVSAIKAIMAKVPGAIPSVNPTGAGKSDQFSDCRKDEINNFDNE